ncbi:hypothetical protein BIV57_05195 [Mangrovactinospora gilvigrisea]|uniref:Uncharacterized protein n=1 Tax=Mangrovactinospora gilvigrisea TaxID=1428644 RepID=A0A1J7BIN6_9ACTN|nr:hypothetical protein [Mangrovactinospora gilvigrisea]OIV38531.1 hypothetical protein BIV57_05195 [Mangrovactinospora gilvigrisea]
MRTSWRLERTYLSGVGYPEARCESLDINFADSSGPIEHSVVCGENGVGKTTMTALRFSLYLPHVRDFIRGDSDRSLAKLVRGDDVCHVVEQATRIVGDETQRIVLGMVAHWSDGVRHLDEPGSLARTYYGWITYGTGPSLVDLPFRTTSGNRTPAPQYLSAVRALLPDTGALPPHPPSSNHEQWLAWQRAADVDLEQVRFQARMNATEGGIDQMMRFHDSDAFVQWFIGATTPPETTTQIGASIDVLRDHAAARPRWQNELRLWTAAAEPLQHLATAHRKGRECREASHAANHRAVDALADADATLGGLAEDAQRAHQECLEHDRRKKAAAARVRNALHHQGRMQTRAAQLRAEAAESTARAARAARDHAARELKAWDLVPTVQQVARIKAREAGLATQLAAAETEVVHLQAHEEQHRHALARILTARRDTAVQHHSQAQRACRRAQRDVERAQQGLHEAVGGRATAAEQLRQHTARIQQTDQELSDAAACGLLPVGIDPATAEAAWAAKSSSALAHRRHADALLSANAEQAESARTAIDVARQQAVDARTQADGLQQRLTQTDDWIEALRHDPHLHAVTDAIPTDLWKARAELSTMLSETADQADNDAAAARADAAAARRTLTAVGGDGLVPSAHIVETLVEHCLAADVTAWTGWRWLADTMRAETAAAFAIARPEIASGMVLASADDLDTAVEAVSDVPLDTAVWIGAVSDPDVAATEHTETACDGTHGHVLLPPAGTYDREAAGAMVTNATADLEDAQKRRQAATDRAKHAREALAALARLWHERPSDPRPAWTDQLHAAHQHALQADADHERATTTLNDLAHHRSRLAAEREEAEHTLEEAAEQRRLLTPLIAAAQAAAHARKDQPRLQADLDRADRHIDDLRRRLSLLAEAVKTADAREHQARCDRDDATEAIRSHRLTATREGAVPDEEPATILARLNGVRAALKDAALDPSIHQDLERTREELADLDARLAAHSRIRRVAVRLAESDEARHQVALNAAIERAKDREAQAREAYARAQQIAETAHHDHQRLAAEHPERACPRIEAVPASDQVAAASEAEQHAEHLGRTARQAQETQRTEEQSAAAAQAAERDATQAKDLIAALTAPMRDLADPTRTGRRCPDIVDLQARLTACSERVRTRLQALADSEAAEHAAAGRVRATAHGSLARTVQESADPGVAELLAQLRVDHDLAAAADHLAERLNERAASLRDDLDRHEQNVLNTARILHLQATKALTRVRTYHHQSLLPDGLGEWSKRHFVHIEHGKVPGDDSVAVDRIVRIVHALLAPGNARSDAETLMFAAVRALVDTPFRVKILKPHTDLRLDRVDVSELKNFSNGQRLTAAVLLYAPMTKVRSMGYTSSIGWLWLDNPFGQASADQFVRTMRRVADKMELQLLFTAAPRDPGALSMFDRVITLTRRLRPVTGERVIDLDTGEREIIDLTLIQRDVKKVLGQ